MEVPSGIGCPTPPTVVRIVERWPPPDSVVLVVNDTLTHLPGSDERADSVVFARSLFRCVVSIELHKGPSVPARYRAARGRHALVMQVVERDSTGSCPRE